MAVFKAHYRLPNGEEHVVCVSSRSYGEALAAAKRMVPNVDFSRLRLTDDPANVVVGCESCRKQVLHRIRWGSLQRRSVICPTCNAKIEMHREVEISLPLRQTATQDSSLPRIPRRERQSATGVASCRSKRAETENSTAGDHFVRVAAGLIIGLAIFGFINNRTSAPQAPARTPLSFGDTVGEVQQRTWSPVPRMPGYYWVERERVMTRHGEYIIDYSDFGGVYYRQRDGSWRRVKDR